MTKFKMCVCFAVTSAVLFGGSVCFSQEGKTKTIQFAGRGPAKETIQFAGRGPAKETIQFSDLKPTEKTIQFSDLRPAEKTIQFSGPPKKPKKESGVSFTVAPPKND